MSRLPQGTLEKLWNDPKHWTLRCFYFCKEDPRFVVPKKPKWGGWTVNFANPKAYLFLVLTTIMILITIVAFDFTRFFYNPFYYLTITIETALVSLYCWFFSSPKRYEEK